MKLIFNRYTTPLFLAALILSASGCSDWTGFTPEDCDPSVETYTIEQIKGADNGGEDGDEALLNKYYRCEGKKWVQFTPECVGDAVKYEDVKSSDGTTSCEKYECSCECKNQYNNYCNNECNNICYSDCDKYKFIWKNIGNDARPCAHIDGKPSGFSECDHHEFSCDEDTKTEFKICVQGKWLGSGTCACTLSQNDISDDEKEAKCFTANDGIGIKCERKDQNTFSGKFKSCRFGDDNHIVSCKVEGDKSVCGECLNGDIDQIKNQKCENGKWVDL